MGVTRVGKEEEDAYRAKYTLMIRHILSPEGLTSVLSQSNLIEALVKLEMKAVEQELRIKDLEEVLKEITKPRLVAEPETMDRGF